MFDKEAFAHRLRVMRVDRRMNQSDLASSSGIAAPIISRYECGENMPGVENLCALAEALGCTPNDLIGWGKSA